MSNANSFSNQSSVFSEEKKLDLDNSSEHTKDSKVNTDFPVESLRIEESKNNKKKFILIDGYGLLFRAFYAMPSLVTEDGTPIGSVYGVCRIIISLLKRYSGSVFIICLDGSSGSFRKEMYPMYKSNRVQPPEELIPQFDLFDELIDAFGIKRCREENYEADDIIASYSNYLAQEGHSCTIVSSDKDLMQLISNNIKFYDPRVKNYITQEDVTKKFGVSPEFLLDYLALVGDSSDNIPGVKSIGSKTAVKIINEHGSIENIYKNIHNISSERIKNALQNSKEDAFLSKKLATLSFECIIPKKDLLEIDSFNFKEEYILQKLDSFSKKYSIDTLKWGSFGGTNIAKKNKSELSINNSSILKNARKEEGEKKKEENFQGSLF